MRKNSSLSALETRRWSAELEKPSEIAVRIEIGVVTSGTNGNQGYEIVDSVSESGAA
jgi:hypothetical protein